MLINEYFNEIESLIDKCVHIVESNISKDRRSLHIGIIEGRIFFKDESLLDFIEFVNVKEIVEVYKYAYHYQKRDASLIFRYDMAPHHREIKTFPHHKHISSSGVTESTFPNFAQVLNEIVDTMDHF
ncbi:conserved hypothetical protein [delta proteobacterium NaphS2]|nr:conserved hypothetical protein [delta proteobacterium NaphS2]